MGWVEKDDDGNVTIHAPAAGERMPPPQPPKAYLDTNLVSALARQHVHPDEVDALFELVELMHEGRIGLVTSTVTKEEIEAVPAEHRAPHQGVYALLERVQGEVEAMNDPAWIY